jgi:hypothetical protein
MAVIKNLKLTQSVGSLKDELLIDTTLESRPTLVFAGLAL